MNPLDVVHCTGMLGGDATINVVNNEKIKSQVLTFELGVLYTHTNTTTGEQVKKIKWRTIQSFFPLKKKVHLTEHLKKGVRVAVVGEPDVKAWLNKENNIVKKLFVRVDAEHIKFI